jgi:hypothetical protein
MPTNQNASNVIELSAKFRAALEKQDAAALQRLITAYGDIYKNLQGQVDYLAQVIENGEYTRTQFIKLARYQDLLTQTGEKLRDFQGGLAMEIASIGRETVATGEMQARMLLSATVIGNPSIAGQFQKLPAEAIQSLLGFLDPKGPLYNRIKMLAPTTVDGISQALLDGLTRGLGAKDIAGNITRAFGMGLTDALRMTRTVQNYSYREANRASYVANSDVVSGWQWFAQLDNVCCMSCVSQHGTIHSVDETLNDHHNGRCAMIPVVKGFGPVIPEEAGKVWFDKLNEGTQKNMMGAGKLQAYQNGLFDWSGLSTTYQDDIYGEMRRETNLKDLLGVD